jgi:hypothetical protein
VAGGGGSRSCGTADCSRRARKPSATGQEQYSPGDREIPPLDPATNLAAPDREHLARLRLIELLTGTHPRYLPGDLHPLIRARFSASAIAARLATTADHVLLAAARNPAPRLPGDSPTARSP